MINTKEFEGLRLSVYKDTLGISTIGYGHNLLGNNEIIWDLSINPKDLINGTRKLTQTEAEMIFDNDIYLAELGARELVPNYSDHPLEIQVILNDLSFNLGKTKLSKFVNTLKAFIEKDYLKAANGLEKSLWYKQVGNRSKKIVQELRRIGKAS